MRLLGVLLVLATLNSCKKTDDVSRSKSLDNLTAGKRLRTNVCAGNPALATHPALIDLLKEVEARTIDSQSSNAAKTRNLNAVKNAFSALPPFAQSQFLAIGGQIVLTPEANRLCTASVLKSAEKAKRSESELAFLREGFSDVRACFLFANPGELEDIGFKSNTHLHTLIILNNETEIAHNFVRVFGYMNTQLSSRLGVKGDFTSSATEVALAADFNPKFTSARAEIAAAYLKDLANRPERKRFERFAAMDPRSPGRIVFEDYVYAEAFDSYFCNQYGKGDLNTLGIMGREFPQTLVAFTKSLASASKGFSLSASRSTASGFALWNPFGWVSNAYTSYTDSRDALIEGMVRNVMEVNGGKPPTALDTVSIAANAAWRPVADVPLLDTFVKPAVKFTDAIAGATIENDGNGRVLTATERARLAAAGTADIALNIAGGAVAEAAGKKIGTVGVAKVTEALVTTSAGRNVVEATVTRLPSQVNGLILKYGAEAAETVVGGAAKNTIEHGIASPTSDAISGLIAGSSTAAPETKAEVEESPRGE